MPIRKTRAQLREEKRHAKFEKAQKAAKKANADKKASEDDNRARHGSTPGDHRTSHDWLGG